VQTLLLSLGIALASQTPGGHGHDAPKTTKTTDFVLKPVGAPPSVGVVKETEDIGLKLPVAERRMRMVVTNAKIEDALKMVSEVGEIKIDVSGNVSGTVTLKLEDVHWNDALYAILKAKKLGFVRQRDTLNVETLKEMRRQAENRPRQLVSDKPTEGAPLITVLVPVKFATADELLPVVRSLLSSRGTVAVDKRGNTLIVTDIAAEEIRDRLVL